MSNRNKNIVWYILILLAIFILFKKKIDNLLLTLVVNPFLSYVNPPSWIFDTTIILMCILTGILYIKKISRNVIIPTYWFFITLICLIVYSIYRISGFPFSFTSFSFSKDIKLLDVVVAFPFLLYLIGILFFTSKKYNTEDTKRGFDIDEPIIIDSNNDLLNRLKYIRNLSETIKNTNSENGSFPIGIVSPWGSGKTTFLHSLKKELKEDNFIIIELDVWKCNSSDQIIDTFFKLLRQALTPFSFSISNKIKEYTNNLIKESKNVFIKSLSEIFLPNQILEQQYESINSEIKRINKKIVVLIDDIDRLNKQEIYEVIRLIRNTANFSNVFFTVAYDRNYILNAIEQINTYQSHIFLEKIFQVEFTLPPIEKAILEKQIRNKLSGFIIANDKASYEELKKGDLYFKLTKTDLAGYFISNMRDVVRFINSFRISYELIKGEIYFPDLYNLHLIKFKHPEIFSEFFRNKNLFLASGTRKNYNPPKPHTYALIQKEIGDGGNTKKDFALKLYLQDQRDIYKINNNEIEIIVKSFSSIFQPHENIELSGPNSFLSVVKPSMFDRYFRLGIESNLSEIEFSKARQLNINEFFDKIDEWSSDKVLIGEVIERFEEIIDFDSREDFEKIIKAIFHLGEVAYYDKANLEIKLNNYENKLEDLYYPNDKDGLRNFIGRLFNEAKSPFLFPSDFITYLDNKYYDPSFFILSVKELSALSITYFTNYCHFSKKLDNDLWRLFWNCEQANIALSGNSSYVKNKKLPSVAIEIMKDFIINKDLNGFLSSLIDSEPFRHKTYNVRDTVLELFETWQAFEDILKGQDQDKWIYLKEFNLFFEAAKEKNFTEYIEFEFETIPVDSVK